MSKEQQIAFYSSIESKYKALVDGATKVQWLSFVRNAKAFKKRGELGVTNF